MKTSTTTRLTLTEYQRSEFVRLTTSQRDTLMLLHPKLRLEPAMGSSDGYHLTPNQQIGVIALPELSIEIRPKVPMSAVLFLISYACDRIHWKDTTPEFGNDADLVELMAIVLARAVQRATRRGLLHGYRETDESLSAPRGRLLFDEQIRRRFNVAPPIEVRHDVFTADILENRLLLAALTAMMSLRLRSENAVRELARARRLFGEVETFRFRRFDVPPITYTQLNRHYEPALEIARLVLMSCSLELGGGGPLGSAFLVDMNLVFERFVRIALREALGASAEQFPDRPPTLYLDEAKQIRLVPDLCLLKKGRVVWVGDAKYKFLPSNAYKHADLYQMTSYLAAQGLDSGVLIYAAGDDTTEAWHKVKRINKQIDVFALDIAAPPPVVLQHLREIAVQAKQSALTVPVLIGS